MGAGQRVHVPDAGVVAGLLVFLPRVAEADDQSNRCHVPILKS